MSACLGPGPGPVRSGLSLTVRQSKSARSLQNFQCFSSVARCARSVISRSPSLRSLSLSPHRKVLSPPIRGGERREFLHGSLVFPSSYSSPASFKMDPCSILFSCCEICRPHLDLSFGNWEGGLRASAQVLRLTKAPFLEKQSRLRDRASVLLSQIILHVQMFPRSSLSSRCEGSKNRMMGLVTSELLERRGDGEDRS